MATKQSEEAALELRTAQRDAITATQNDAGTLRAENATLTAQVEMLAAALRDVLEFQTSPMGQQRRNAYYAARARSRAALATTDAQAVERLRAMDEVCGGAARLRQLHRELLARPLTYEEFKALMADGATRTTVLDAALDRLTALAREKP